MVLLINVPSFERFFLINSLVRNLPMFLVTSPIVINVPTRGLLAVETMQAIVQCLANLNIKRNMTSMFVNKKHRYSNIINSLIKANVV